MNKEGAANNHRDIVARQKACVGPSWPKRDNAPPLLPRCIDQVWIIRVRALGKGGKIFPAAGEDVAFDEVDMLARTLVELVGDHDGLQAHDTVRSQPLGTDLHEAVEIVGADRLDHLDRNESIEAPAEIAIIFEEHVDSVLESGIRDADFAYEAAEMSKYQIMQQAGVAVLGQANRISAGAVRLIG